MAPYRYIIGALCEALGALGIAATHEGVSDMAVGGRKVSGNAQRRRRRALLHHGTLLYDADLDAMARYLREPEDRPDYRAARRHNAFVTTLDATPEALRNAVIQALAPSARVDGITEEERRRAVALASEKYNTRAWTYRR